MTTVEALRSEPLRFVAAPAKGEVSALLLRPADARWLLRVRPRRRRRHAPPVHGGDERAPRRRRHRHLALPVPLHGGRQPPARQPRATLLATVRAAVRAAARGGARPAAARRRQVDGRPDDLAGRRRGAACRRARPRVLRLPAASGRPAVDRARRSSRAGPSCRCCSCRASATSWPSWSCCARSAPASARARPCTWSRDADHGFHVPKRSGRTDAEVQGELAQTVAAWAAALP